ncbi:MAG TPA: hypothetical protein PK867_28255, partial [Pirellulales bacterium]|nr:hypothetical protein [Pirellulales bacterium]
MDAGAIITPNAHDKDGTISAIIWFRHAKISGETARSLAKLFDSDAAEGPRASLDELGPGRLPLELWFERCRIGPDELGALSGAKRLAGLAFMQTPLDDDAFSAVKTMPRLDALQIDGSDVGDAALHFLDTSPLLHGFSARRTRIGDHVLQVLSGAKEMR